MTEHVDKMRLAIAYSQAKNKRDPDRALALCDPDIVLASDSFGSVAHGLAQARQSLERFFLLFSGYHAEADHRFTAGNALMAAGHVKLRVNNAMLLPNLREQPVEYFLRFISCFEFRGDLIAVERYFVDINLTALSQVLVPEVAVQMFEKRD